MRESRFSDEEIHGIVRQIEAGAQRSEVTRQDGISKKTLRRRRAKYRGLELEEVRRLKALEDEHCRLTRHL